MAAFVGLTESGRVATPTLVTNWGATGGRSATSRPVATCRERSRPTSRTAAAAAMPSDRRTRYLWKGVASYHAVVIDGRRAHAAAWVYAEPKPAAAGLAGHVAFWNGVRVVSADDPPT